jgi:hypothetical protein
MGFDMNYNAFSSSIIHCERTRRKRKKKDRKDSCKLCNDWMSYHSSVLTQLVVTFKDPAFSLALGQNSTPSLPGNIFTFVGVFTKI